MSSFNQKSRGYIWYCKVSPSDPFDGLMGLPAISNPSVNLDPPVDGKDSIYYICDPNITKKKTCERCCVIEK